MSMAILNIEAWFFPLLKEKLESSYMHRRAGVCWRGYVGATCSSLSSTTGSLPPFQCLGASNPVSTVIGVGLSGICYWQRNSPFVDVMKSSSSWIAQHIAAGDFTWSTEEYLPGTEDGDYPTSLGRNQGAGVMMLRDLAENAENGDYVVRWDGDGILICSLDVVLIVRSPGKMVCTMSEWTLYPLLLLMLLFLLFLFLTRS